MTASSGSLYATGKSGRRYAIDLYLPDAVGGIVLFSASGAAGTTSLNHWKTPEDMVVTDVSVITGTTAVGAYLTASGGVLNGTVLRYANHLNTLNNRPQLNIAIRGNTDLGATQI